MSLANILKESTKEAHAIAESKPFQQAMLGGDIELKLLGKYFVQLHAIHEAIENHFETHSQVAEILVWNESRCHSRNLESDLRALNMWEDFEILDITQDFINESIALNWKNKTHTFNFMINKPRISRKLLLHYGSFSTLTLGQIIEVPQFTA